MNPAPNPNPIPVVDPAIDMALQDVQVILDEFDTRIDTTMTGIVTHFQTEMKVILDKFVDITKGTLSGISAAEASLPELPVECKNLGLLVGAHPTHFCYDTSNIVEYIKAKRRLNFRIFNVCLTHFEKINSEPSFNNLFDVQIKTLYGSGKRYILTFN